MVELPWFIGRVNQDVSSPLAIAIFRLCVSFFRHPSSPPYSQVLFFFHTSVKSRAFPNLFCSLFLAKGISTNFSSPRVFDKFILGEHLPPSYPGNSIPYVFLSSVASCSVGWGEKKNSLILTYSSATAPTHLSYVPFSCTYNTFDDLLLNNSPYTVVSATVFVTVYLKILWITMSAHIVRENDK